LRADDAIVDAFIEEYFRGKPLRARLHIRDLTPAELALCQAACEVCSDGQNIYAGVETLAAFSKLSVRQTQRLIGHREKPPGVPLVPWPHSLLARRWWRLVAPSNPHKRRPATYAITEVAMPIDPAVRSLAVFRNRARQRTLAGVTPPRKPWEQTVPIVEDATYLVTPCHQGGDDSVTLVTPCHQTGDTMSPYPKSLYSKSTSVTSSSNPVDVWGTNKAPGDTMSPVPPGFDRRAVSQAILQSVEIDHAGVEQIIHDSLEVRPDLQTEEALYFLSQRVAQIHAGTIRNPAGFLRVTLPKCFDGEAFGEWRNRRTAAAKIPAQCPACRGEVSEGTCTFCGSRV
jgi:hypothetical protein